MSGLPPPTIEKGVKKMGQTQMPQPHPNSPQAKHIFSVNKPYMMVVHLSESCSRQRTTLPPSCLGPYIEAFNRTAFVMLE